MKRIVLTGGPGGGKTELKKHLLKVLRERKVNALAVPEIPTIVFGMGITAEALSNPGISWLFQETVMRQQQLLEKQSEALLQELGRPDHKREDILLLDRTALDQLVYMSRANFILLLRNVYYDQVTPYQSDYDIVRHFMTRFDLVINMVTAADGAEEHYNCENNSARSETPEHARALENKTQAAYAGHPNRVIVPNRIRNLQISFAEKLLTATTAVLELLDLPR